MTFTDINNKQQTASITGNGIYSVDLSKLADGHAQLKESVILNLVGNYTGHT